MTENDVTRSECANVKYSPEIQRPNDGTSTDENSMVFKRQTRSKDLEIKCSLKF